MVCYLTVSFFRVIAWKREKTLSLFQNNVQNPATYLVELLQVQVDTNNLRQEGEERQPQPLKVFNKVMVQEQLNT